MSYNSLRTGRRSEPGRDYFITVVTRHRAKVFEDFCCARLLVREMRALAAFGQLQPQAWVIMPDHFHLLATLGDEMPLSDTIRLLKGRSARSVNQHINARHQLWQPGFYDHALRREEDRLAVARYIVANPLRAGLVGRLADYPHWDCTWL